MGINIRCATCGSAYSVAEQWAGKKAKCPKCSSQIDVPTSAHSELANPNRVSTNAILAAINQDVPHVEMPITYRIALAMVALLMVILPLLYLALILGICYALVLHAVHDTVLLGATGSGRGAIIGFLLYIAPLIAGSIVVFFMCKPLLARQASDERTRSLTRDSDPLLYAFVERLSNAVGAPVPSRINVDCQVNASAGFGKGLFAGLGAGELVLTIGLPLVAGLDLRQFTSVIAHELGHFSQGAGMRLFWVVAHVNNWFARAVYQRDQWDERLESASQNVDIRFALILLCAQFGVALTRKVLWCFMMLGHIASAHLSRSMEYDADRKAASLVGSETSALTLEIINLLDFAQQKACADLDLFFSDGRLADNLPRLVALNARDFDAEDLEKIKKLCSEIKAGLFDTHPSPARRAKNISRAKAPCRFAIDQPATILFGNFDQLAKAVTLDVYFANFGPRFDRSKIHPLDQLVAKRDREKKAEEILKTYMLGQVSQFRPLWLPSRTLAKCDDPRATFAELKRSRDEVMRLSTSYAEDLKKFEKAHNQRVMAEIAKAIFDIGGDSRITRQLDPPIDSRQQANSLLEKSRILTNQLVNRMTLFEQAMGERLMVGLTLLSVDKVATKVSAGQQWFVECGRIVPILDAVEKEHHNFCTVYPLFSKLGALLALGEYVQGEDRWVRRVLKTAKEIHEQLGCTRQMLLQVEYNMDHVEKDMTVGRYLLSEMPPVDNPLIVHQAADSMIDAYELVQKRLRSRLATVAGKVETVLGFKPLEAPPSDG